MTRKRKVLIVVIFGGCIAFIVLVLPLFIRAPATSSRKAMLMLLAKPPSQSGTNATSQSVTNDSEQAK
jgi:ABC-type cobalamin transport system permease subunit